MPQLGKLPGTDKPKGARRGVINAPATVMVASVGRAVIATTVEIARIVLQTKTGRSRVRQWPLNVRSAPLMPYSRQETAHLKCRCRLPQLL